MLGASTVAHRFALNCCLTPGRGGCSRGCGFRVKWTIRFGSSGEPFTTTELQIDEECVSHPFSLHKLDAGPVRLMTIAHAFNYRTAVFG